MNPQSVQKILIGGMAAVLAAFLGVIIAEADYIYLALLLYAVIATIAIVAPGTSALLAFGLLSPFSIPLPIIQGFPAVLMITMLCYLKLFLSRLLVRNPTPLPTPRVHWLVAVFFGCVAVRYLIDPVLPNIAGIGSDVTGFRSYLNYGTSFLLIIGMPWFLNDRESIVRFIRWCGTISLVLCFLLMPLTFTSSMTVVALLNRLGVFVATFDNGMLRFVVLPIFGLMLISIGLIPQLANLPVWQRRLYLIVGMGAVILGGSRSGLLMLYALLFAVAVGQRKLLKLAYWTAVFALCLVGFRYIGEYLIPAQQSVGVLRILSIASNSVAERTDAVANKIWRDIRWERAIFEIRNRPWIGRGYGGLDNAFVFATREEFEEARIEIDVASGNIHNGYLSGAMALGVPAGGLFILILCWQSAHSAWNIRATRIRGDPFWESYHTFALAQMAMVSVWILIGTDIGRSNVWWWIQFAYLPALLAVRTKSPTRSTEPALPGRIVEPASS